MQCIVDNWIYFVLVQSSQSLAQVSELQSQLEEAMKEKQEVQEKVRPQTERSLGAVALRRNCFCFQHAPR